MHFIRLRRMNADTEKKIIDLIIIYLFEFFYYQVRHIKLVHSINSYQRSTSPALGEGGESLLVANDNSKPVSNNFR